MTLRERLAHHLRIGGCLWSILYLLAHLFLGAAVRRFPALRAPLLFLFFALLLGYFAHGWWWAVQQQRRHGEQRYILIMVALTGPALVALFAVVWVVMK